MPRPCGCRHLYSRFGTTFSAGGGGGLPNSESRKKVSVNAWAMHDLTAFPNSFCQDPNFKIVRSEPCPKYILTFLRKRNVLLKNGLQPFFWSKKWAYVCFSMFSQYLSTPKR
jgi:hypothetical protein